jgi:hypothetical protein
MDGMGQRFDEITPELKRFIEAQWIFYLTAPTIEE